MQRHEFGPVQKNPERLRELLTFMGQTAVYERGMVAYENIPFASQSPFAGPDRQIMVQRELQLSYKLVNDMLHDIGGIRYPTVHPQTGQPMTVILDSWDGVAPQRPNCQWWRSGKVFFMIKDSFLDDLQSLLEPSVAVVSADVSYAE